MAPGIALSDVSWTYSDRANPQLTDIDLTIAGRGHLNIDNLNLFGTDATKRLDIFFANGDALRLNPNTGDTSIIVASPITTFTGTWGTDVMKGYGAQNETFFGLAGDDTFMFGAGGGEDVIVDNQGRDTLVFGPGIHTAGALLSQVGNDLHVRTGSGVTIRDWFLGAENRIETFTFADGTTVTAEEVDDILANGGVIGGTPDIAPVILPAQSSVGATIQTIVHRQTFDSRTQMMPVLAEERALATSHINGTSRGNLTLDEALDMQVKFVNDGGAYKSALGMYTVGTNGVISNVQLLSKNFSGTGSGIYGGGALEPGDTLASLRLAKGTEIGFFLVADGYNGNSQFKKFSGGHFEFRDVKNGNTPATLDDRSKNVQLVYVHDATGKVTKVEGDVFHATSTTLNGDGKVHTVSGIDTAGNLQIAFEDLKGQGDRDFNDAVVQLQFSTAVTHKLEPVSIAAHLSVTDADNNTIASANISFAAGRQAGDTLSIITQGTNITATQNADGSLSLSGTDTAAHYQNALRSLAFSSTAEDPVSGIRAVAIAVTDADNLTATGSIDVIIGAPPPAPPVQTPVDYNQIAASALAHLHIFGDIDGAKTLNFNTHDFDDINGYTMEDRKGNDKLTLKFTDIFDTPETLTILGDKNDQLTLQPTAQAPAFTHVATETIGGHDYAIYSAQSSHLTLVIDADVSVKILMAVV